jgi:hypothetical protein
VANPRYKLLSSPRQPDGNEADASDGVSNTTCGTWLFIFLRSCKFTEGNCANGLLV